MSKALHDDGDESHWIVVIEAPDGAFFGTGMIVEVFWNRDWLKVLMKTPAS